MTRNNRSEIRSFFYRPLYEIVAEAKRIHEKNFESGEIQVASLLSIKTGGCPENCSYCPQSAHFKSGIKKSLLMTEEAVISAALAAQNEGALRFCMGAAWKNVRDGKDFDQVINLVKAVKGTGLEVCCTLGMLTKNQAQRLKAAGLYAYNHNIDTSREHYSKIVQTRTYDDRLNTIQNVRDAGLTVCTGGILGLGESEEDRISFIHQLASLTPHPESITVNTLVPAQGTPLHNSIPVDALDVVRVIGTLRVFLPKSVIRLSAGRLTMSDEAQFLCYFSGANSIFLGEKLLTSPNPPAVQDIKLLGKLGFRMKKSVSHDYGR